MIAAEWSYDNSRLDRFDTWSELVEECRIAERTPLRVWEADERGNLMSADDKLSAWLREAAEDAEDERHEARAYRRAVL